MRDNDALISKQISKTAHTREANGTIADLVDELTKQLSSRGFGILTNIDFQMRIMVKAGHDVGGCIVLDVCQTEHARRALIAHNEAVLALPCKKAVYEHAGKVLVSLFKITENMRQLGFTDLDSFAMKVKSEIEGAIDSVAIN